MIKIERAMIRDIPTLALLEIRCQDYAIPSEAIKDYIEQPNGYGLLAKISNKAIGYALHQSLTAESEPNVPFTVITRIGVQPEFRGLGACKQLMFEIEKQAWKQSHRCLKIYVPSYRCDDIDDPEYIVPLMEKFHFKISKCLDRMFYHYGKRWDAYIFERQL